MSTTEAPAVLRTGTVAVSWTCQTQKCLHTAEFDSQDMALAFVAGSRRDTAYTLVHPEPQR